MPLERLTKTDPLQLGRFTILARLGGGGMGVVYLAEADDGTPAAVKVVKAELALDPAFRARFRREVEAGLRVTSRCTAKFLAADTHAPSPWLATEFVPGATLHHEVHARGPIVGPRLLGLAAGLADALAQIHKAGLVHRDLKPANILLAPDAPKVIDFGISLALDATALTRTGTLVGSPAYMSPEQARGEHDVTPAADVFSWASVLTFACRKDPPFGEGEAAGLLYKVVNVEPDLTGVAPALLPFVRAALAKEPADRPTAAELSGGIAAVLGGAPAASVVVPAGEGRPAHVVVPEGAGDAVTVLAATWEVDERALEEAEATLVEAHKLRREVPRSEAERIRAERRASRGLWAAMVAVALAVLVGGALVLRGGSGDAEARYTGTDEVAAGGETTTTTAAGAALEPGPPATPPSVPRIDIGPVTTAPLPVAPTTAPPAQATPTTATTRQQPVAPTTAGPPPPPPPSPAVTCTATVAPARTPAGELRFSPPEGDKQLYTVQLTITQSSGASASTARVALLRSGVGQRTGEAWAREVPANGSVTVGPFEMVRLGDARGTDTEVDAVHAEAPGQAFVLTLRTLQQNLLTSCGDLKAAAS